MEECIWVDDGWLEELLWCPSQCYRRVKCGEKIYTLYLRWRWEDPWQFMVIEGDAVEEHGPYLIDLKQGKAFRIVDFKNGEPVLREVTWRFISDDLFAEHGLFFRDEELREAEKAAEQLFFEWIRKRKEMNSL